MNPHRHSVRRILSPMRLPIPPRSHRCNHSASGRFMHRTFGLGIHDNLMFQTENDLLANLIVLSPKVARKRFRESIFESWDWKCAYCDKQLDACNATIDHIVPKHKGGHNTRSNLACACTNCNKSKGSQHVFDYMGPSNKYYSEQRVGKIRNWMQQKPCSLRINSTEQAVPYICHDATLGWIAV